MKSRAVPIALLVFLAALGLAAQAPRPRPPAPKPVEDVPPPNLGPAVPTPDPSPLVSRQGGNDNTRRWTMFDGNLWPSEEQMALLARFCSIESSDPIPPYNPGPDARETAVLEAAATDIQNVLATWQQRRRIIIAPIGSQTLNAWTINTETIRYLAAKRGQQIKMQDGDFSLICVPQGMLNFLSDAPQELEAVVAHEAGHAVDIPCYEDVRPRSLFPQNVQRSCESRADVFALDVLLVAHKNIYALAGFFGRFEMAFGDISTSFLARLRNFNNDHPITPDRIKTLRNMLAEIRKSGQPQPLPPITP